MNLKELDKKNIRILINNDSFHAITHVTLIFYDDRTTHYFFIILFSSVANSTYKSIYTVSIKNIQKLNFIFIMKTLTIYFKNVGIISKTFIFKHLN